MPVTLALLLFLSTVLPIPAGTPIACVVCAASIAANSSTFSGTVSFNDPVRLRVYNSTTLRTMMFTVPDGFRGVDSGDGVIKNASLTRATPGLFARVTYTSVHGLNTASRVLLLTVEQCRSLVASERLTKSKTECPD